MKQKVSIFLLLLCCTNFLSASFNDTDNKHHCDSARIKSEIWRIKQLAQRIERLSKNNIDDLYTKDLTDGVQKLCSNEQVIYNLIDNLKGCSQHEVEDIENEKITMLKFFQYLLMESIIHHYHPEGHC
jgi:hypothetical protein